MKVLPIRYTYPASSGGWTAAWHGVDSGDSGEPEGLAALDACSAGPAADLPASVPQPSSLASRRADSFCWIAQIHKHFDDPKPSYVADWDSLPKWQHETDADIFECIEATR